MSLTTFSPSGDENKTGLVMASEKEKIDRLTTVIRFSGTNWREARSLVVLGVPIGKGDLRFRVDNKKQTTVRCSEMCTFRSPLRSGFLLRVVHVS